jgi:uncharacterized protein YjbJ (UPF0337 family)
MSIFVLWIFIINFKIQKMNKTVLKGNWKKQKGRLRQKFAILTYNDFMLIDGKKEEMFGRLQIKLGKTKEELHKIIVYRLSLNGDFF